MTADLHVTFAYDLCISLSLVVITLRSLRWIMKKLENAAEIKKLILISDWLCGLKPNGSHPCHSLPISLYLFAHVHPLPNFPSS